MRNEIAHELRKPRKLMPCYLGYDVAGEPGRQRKRKKLTLDQFASLEYLPYIKKNLKSWSTNERLLRKHVSPVFGARKLLEIRRGEIRDFQLHLLKSGFTVGTSNRCLAALSSLFSYAEYRGFIPLGMSPCYKIAPLPTQKRPPYIAPSEKIAELTHLLENRPEASAKALLLILLTGARKNEILKARWEDIDWENGKLRSSRAIRGRQHWIPLNESAMQILQKMATIKNGQWLFPGKKPDRPVCDLFMAWKGIRAELGIPQMTIEDLRFNITDSEAAASPC